MVSFVVLFFQYFLCFFSSNFSTQSPASGVVEDVLLELEVALESTNTSKGVDDEFAFGVDEGVSAAAAMFLLFSFTLGAMLGFTSSSLIAFSGTFLS